MNFLLIFVCTLPIFQKCSSEDYRKKTIIISPRSSPLPPRPYYQSGSSLPYPYTQTLLGKKPGRLPAEKLLQRDPRPAKQQRPRVGVAAAELGFEFNFWVTGC